MKGRGSAVGGGGSREGVGVEGLNKLPSYISLCLHIITKCIY